MRHIPLLSTLHQLNPANTADVLRTRPSHCGLIAVSIRGTTDTKPDVGIQACGASDGVDHIANAGTYIASHAKPSILDKSDSSPALTLSQPNQGLPRSMASVVLGKRDCEVAECPGAKSNATSTFETIRQLLIADLGLGPTSFRAPVAIMYKTDENGHYIPKDSTSAKRQKMANSRSRLGSTDEGYANVPRPPVADGVQGQEVADDTDSAVPSIILVGDGSSDSDSSSDIVLD